LAADGAKLALWKLWRAGYRIVNFIHDEVLVEVPADSDLTHHGQHIQQLMVEGMQEVLPDVRVSADYAAMDRWWKSAEAVFDESGKLLLWRPVHNNAA
jgi:DNA polymerase I-like protein with 3'-5' exonuclease and polymerase domains